MQAQRSIQRRSPAADPGPPPTVPARSMSPSGPGMPPRTSSSSAKLSQNGSRRQNTSQPPQGSPANPPLSQIEKSVTHLLVATKQLLETLTQWSRHQATDSQVSDVYVRLGYEFNIACRAFSAINVDITDLGNVPELLRHILESTLSQEASVESLEKYLPRIRDIIINLLHGLKRKQQKLRQKQTRDSASQNGDGSIPRNSSVGSVASGNTGLTSLLDQGIANNYQSGDSGPDGRENVGGNDTSIPPRMSSASTNRKGLPDRVRSRESLSSGGSTMSSSTMQSMPILPPYPGDEAPLPIPPEQETELERFPPPPPPPKQQNPLAALQRGGDLERRASRRYSAYQISKHLGGTNGIPMLPPAQNSPIPNRGRNDARESMRAVQNRTDQRHVRQQSTRIQTDVSPARIPSRISEEGNDAPEITPPAEQPADDSPMAKTPEDKIRQSVVDFDGLSATLQGPPSDSLPILSEPEKEDQQFPEPPKHQHSTSSTSTVRPQPQQRDQFTPEPSPPPGKELTLFLQYKTKVKKFVLQDGFNELSLARLQLAFMDKFSWNTHSTGVDLPEIYIQDPVSGVRHELEDLSDIKDRSVLVLNFEVLDEVKRHIDEGLGGIRKVVEGVKNAVDDQQAAIQRVSDRQQDAAKEIARLATAPPPSTVTSGSIARSSGFNTSKLASPAHLNEVQSLKRDLAVIRQTYSNFQSEIRDSMNTIRNKASSVKVEAAKTLIPKLDDESGRAYVNEKKKKLNSEYDTLVGQVDDLQDLIEELRKDVVTRGVRPLPRQLETAAKDLAQATMGLKKIRSAVDRESPLFTKVWERELTQVADDQESMKQQKQLNEDLQTDLEEVAEVLALVEQATKEQMKDAPGANATRNISQTLRHVIAADPAEAKEGVLGQVRALQPNHESRLEAIERAERQRQKDLESRRGGEFQKELGAFVEEGKLKKAGGFEEVERARKLKDERIRREVWERQNGMTQADATADEPAGDEPPAEEGEENAEGGEAPDEI
ncbi:AIP3-domain-containing protein [Mollisia scopiformis]|uniref:AIP3-domain-containing protein n=1 Tax=Mollisia scopiformis TaxID=149040 RepID=A0A194XDD7_MOLSC|nr:AIP3-domain-containing protein [Mollisia scopiformis]KUJ18188.1 AIP3-domain-containing protein [Mollisia scopiformis]